MNEKFPIVTFCGLRFNLAIDLSVVITCIIVFAVVFAFSRKPQLRPTKKQNLMEWLMDFTNNIVDAAIPPEDSGNFYLFAFVLFAFIFVSNQLGLLIELIVGGNTWIDSPTANAVVTLGLAMMVLLMSHSYGVKKYGFKGYLKGYIKPMLMLLPINLVEEFTNFMTLGLRLYGNIFAGEVLLMLVADMATSLHMGAIAVAPLEMIWQAFSAFIGSIQAFVFVTLGMVYISSKLQEE